MTKQEKIQEAYGEVYDRYSEFINENGWIKKLSLIPSFEVCEIDFKGKFQRPKNLFNLENNNGWIRIESENDLPKEANEYWVKHNDGDILTLFATNAFLLKNCTHYQPIIKPQPPIY